MNGKKILAKECTKPRNNHEIGKSTSIKEVAALLKNVWIASIQCILVGTCTQKNSAGIHSVNIHPETAVTDSGRITGKDSPCKTGKKGLHSGWNHNKEVILWKIKSFLQSILTFPVF